MVNSSHVGPTRPFLDPCEYDFGDMRGLHHSTWGDLQPQTLIGSENEAWERLVSTPPTFDVPLCITVAMGFDTFVVMRHGQRCDTDNTVLSCYFCNDLTSPADSLIYRPLDQQCTVTRPGVSLIASAVAAEFIASISQHPLSPQPPHVGVDNGPSNSTYSCLGATPHCLRGSLSDFQMVITETEAFQQCVSCSIPIATELCSPNKFQFLSRVIGSSSILEEITGLAEMKRCQREVEVLTFDDV